jgi:hypothetical protein
MNPASESAFPGAASRRDRQEGDGHETAPSGAAPVAKLPCLLREGTAPDRRRELSRTTDRGCERAGGGAGCHAGFRGAWALAAEDGSGPRCPKAKGRGHEPVRLHVQPGTGAREAANCGPVASLNSSCKKKQVTVVVTNLVCGSNYIVRSICRGCLSLLGASPQYGAKTDLATAKGKRKRDKMDIAYSPRIQSVRCCSRFA